MPHHLHIPLAYAVTSVLAIGGIGGLAIGLAGREICENLLNGFLIMSTVSAVMFDLHNFSILVLTDLNSANCCAAL
jgi:hypothetical protein